MARRGVLRSAAGLVAGTVAAVTAGSGAAAAAAGVAAEQDPLLRRKQVRGFEVLDVDGDGVVTPADTVRLANSFAGLTGNSPGSPRARQMVTAINEIWQTLVDNPVDVPDPRSLDVEQFVTVMANRIATMPDTTMLYIGVLTNLTFAMLDDDNDGLITEADAKRLGTEIVKLSDDEAEQTWAAMRTADPARIEVFPLERTLDYAAVRVSLANSSSCSSGVR
ncbi:hypothetical protein INP57_24105 [Saccharopolyspora sp. HNM0986]|uniref:hypothetical protein n=1 Tax=Saccharopolyspora galaxeae TaxID=2781241 RepID=UPI00190D68EA|nr:hypothetical protein [Saccharopolyspora sp. HNM0986]MBK0869902.1 hypothetical protein [Saccharopolyspora sp. HNM0986]